MLTLDAKEVKPILVNELGYKPLQAERYLSMYPPIHAELEEAVQRWLVDRSVIDASVLGLSIREVMNIQDCHFLMAVRDLNRLLDADLTPEDRKRLVRILRTLPVYR